MIRSPDSEGTALFSALAARVSADPASVPDPRSLSRAAGISLEALAALIVEHAHMEPSAWLRRKRVAATFDLLLHSHRSMTDVAEAAGFRSVLAFERDFLAEARMPPEAYRRLPRASEFELRLPARYRARDILAYHGRDPASPGEQVEGPKLTKAVALTDMPAVLEIHLLRQRAVCRVHGLPRPSADAMQAAHAMVLRLLGLTGNVRGFEAQARRDSSLAPLVANRPGLHLPLTATVFDGLCWAILGQQINLAFACALRREILALAGERIGHLIVHPTPRRLAALDVPTLRERRFSRSKAEYLLGTASAVVSGRIEPERFCEQSAVSVERELTRLRGIGTWTARYTMMRGVGFSDVAPIGDVALAAALAKLTGATRRPTPDEAEALMQRYSPYRSLATFHLWASLRDER